MDATSVKMPPTPHPNALNATAIGMRNRGQFYHPGQLGGKGPIYIGDWLRQEFERYGYDLKDMAQL